MTFPPPAAGKEYEVAKGRAILKQRIELTDPGYGYRDDEPIKIDISRISPINVATCEVQIPRFAR